MSTSNSLQCVFPDTDGKAEISCPFCQNHIRLNVSALIGSHRPLNISCGCGKKFAMVVDTRTFRRKSVHLPGQYMAPYTTVSGNMTVEDISPAGVKFRTKLNHQIQKGDILNITFVLDNATRSEIAKTVVIRYVNDRVVGAEFCDVQANEALYISLLFQS